MKKIILLIFLTSNYLFSQKINNSEIQGIWIAEDFYNSFTKNKNILDSKDDFQHNFPVGLRFNLSEINGSIWNVGYSYLHDHNIHNEVSGFKIINNKKISEQGTFEMDLSNNQKGIYNLKANDESPASFYTTKLSYENNVITLNISERNKYNIKYVKVLSEFKDDYEFPNPLYYFTRKVLLQGDYTLKDSLNNILSKKITIKTNGKITGSEIFNKKFIMYSTDIYCGPPTIDEIVLICENSEVNDFKCEVYVFKREKNNTIVLYKDYAREEWNSDKVLKNKMYKLIKY